MSDAARTILDRLTLQARIDLGRTVPDLPLQDSSPEEEQRATERMARKYQEWVASLRSGENPAAARARLRGAAVQLERQIDRRLETIKHAPTQIDRERAEARIAALESQLAEVREALGEGAVTWADLNDEYGPSGDFCRECGARLRDAEQAWDQMGLCSEHFAIRIGGEPPTRKGVRP